MASPSRASPTMLDPAELAGALRDTVARPNLSADDASAALEEFAWTCLVGGVRVRDYCRLVSEAVQAAPLKGVLGLALIHPTTRLMLPFTTLPTNAYAFAQPPPPPLLAPAPAAAVTRKQVIDALVRLSREPGVADGSAPRAEERAVEACLEYVGRRWRTASDDDVVDGIGRKLTEVEFEIQLQGDPLTVRAVIAPTLQRLRFILGLCTAAQLVTRLNSSVASTRPPYDATQISQAWVERRLSAGADPARVGHELVAASERCQAQAHQAAIARALRDFGVLDRRDPGDLPDERQPSPPTSPVRKRALSRFGSITRKSISSSLSAAPSRWFAHRHTSSTTGRLQALGFGSDRRPSLPSISTPTLIMPPADGKQSSMHSTAYLPLTPTSPWSPALSTGTPGSNPRASSSTGGLDGGAPSQLVSSLMTFTEPEEVRLILLDYLLGMRYRVATVADNGWHLGLGRARAASVLDSVEDKLVGRRDVMGLKVVLDDLRARFRLAIYYPSPSLDRKASRRKRSVESRRGLAVSRATTHEEPFDLEAYLDETYDTKELPAIVEAHAVPRGSIIESASSVYAPSVRSMVPLRPGSAGTESDEKRLSTGANSILSVASRRNGRYRRSSLMSSYTIREATRAFPLSLKPKHFRFSGMSTGSLEDFDSGSDGAPERSPYDTRLAKSTNDLLAETYTRAPGTLRRTRQRINGFNTSLSADDLGLRRSPLPSPHISVPPSPMTPPASPGRGIPVAFSPLPPPPATPPPDSPPSPDFVPVDMPDSASTQVSPPASLRPQPSTSSDSSGFSVPGSTPRPSRSQRNLHRRVAIVDGEQWSPTNSPVVSPRAVVESPVPEIERTPPSPRPAMTVLRLVLQLFQEERGKWQVREGLGEGELERVLNEAVQREREHVAAQGEDWNAEARRRLAWLIGQVGKEMRDARHVQVVDRVLQGLSRPPPLSLRLTRRASQASFMSAAPSITARLASTTDWPFEPVPESPPASPPASPRTFTTSRLGTQSRSSFALAPDSPPMSSRTFGSSTSSRGYSPQASQQQRLADAYEPKLGWLNEVSDGGTLPGTPTILRRFASQDATLRRPSAPLPSQDAPSRKPDAGSPPRPPRRLFETPPLRFGRLKLEPPPSGRRAVSN